MNLRITAAVLAPAMVVMTVMAMTPRAADAAPYWPWCSRYGDPRGYGAVSCAFSSWEQCMDTVRGIGGWCYTNPYPNPHPTTPARLAKPHRHAAK
jgi:hypothetical protein